MLIRPVEESDSSHWERMRQSLWPSPDHEHATEIAAFFQGDRRNPAEVFIAFDDAREPIGFAEVSIRPYAEGCVSSPVAYLEGWFVVPEARCRGVGRALIEACEAWGRSQGCTEFASDAEPDNDVSAAAHRSLGFEDLGLVRCLRKEL